MRRIDRHYYEKILGSLPKHDPRQIIRERKALQLSLFSLIVSIIIAVPSLYFAWKSVELSKESKEQAQKIEKMEDVLLELKEANKIQARLLSNSDTANTKSKEQIQSLQEMGSTLLSVANSQQRTAEAQLHIAKTNENNTAPKISLSDYYEIKFIDSTHIRYRCQYKNVGNRNALDVTFKFYCFQKTREGFILVPGKNDMYSIPQVLSANNGYGFAEKDIIKQNGKFINDDIENIYCKLVIDYKDELTKKKLDPSINYFVWIADDNFKVLQSLTPGPDEKNLMDSLLKIKSH